MAFFRKKPVVIEARQFDGTIGSWNDIERWIYPSSPTIPSQYREDKAHAPKITTLEGQMEATPGDWIIKGVHGEFYPCKPDVFEKTYEPASSDSP